MLRFHIFYVYFSFLNIINYYCNTKAQTQLTACSRNKHIIRVEDKHPLDILPNIGTELKLMSPIVKNQWQYGVRFIILLL